MEKQIKFKLLGMDADSDVSILDGTSSIENYNVRFTVAEDGQTNAVITNERGTKFVSTIPYGTPIGYYSISDYLVIFSAASHNSYIFIYKLKGSQLECLATYEGGLNFSTSNPIECQGVWEREDLLKVFWIDGKNPLRFITISPNLLGGVTPKSVDQDYFDAVRFIDFDSESIEVTKQSIGGVFPVGTIQYAFTYYSKYGSESNIFKITPLFYIGDNNSGAPADRSVSCSFKIKISNVDHNWDYVRVYSISRTSINSTPVCKRVVDIDISSIGFVKSSDDAEEPEVNTLTYIDNGEYGETIDSTRLYYVGGERITPRTIAQKDGTLFLGNYDIVRSEIDDLAKFLLISGYEKESFFKTSYNNTEGSNVVRKVVSVIEDAEALNSNYQYTAQLSRAQNDITTFKSGETYRIGVQLQDKTGRWSEPIWMFDATNNIYPNTISGDESTSTKSRVLGGVIEGPIMHQFLQFNKWPEELKFDSNFGNVSGILPGGKPSNSSRIKDSAIKAILPFGHLKLDLSKLWDDRLTLVGHLLNLGYKRIRPLIVYPTIGGREVLFQGVANPTIKKGVVKDDDNTIKSFDYRIPSWFFRPIKPYGGGFETYNIGNSYHGVHQVYEDNAEIPYYKYENLYKNSQAEFQYETNDKFYIDWSTLTIDSPELRFDEQLSLTDLEGAKMRVIGYVDLSGNAASYKITIDGSTEPPEDYKSSSLADTIPMGNKIAVPFKDLSGAINSTNYGASLINYPLWIDGISDRGSKGYDAYFAQWYVFPWQRNGSLNNCSSVNMNNIEGAPKPSVLKRKVLANSRFGYNTVYTKPDENFETPSIKHARVFLQDSDNQIDRFPDGTLYRNSVDLVLIASGLTPFLALGQAVYNHNKDLKPEGVSEADEYLTYYYAYGNLYGTDYAKDNDGNPKFSFMKWTANTRGMNNTQVMRDFFRLPDNITDTINGEEKIVQTEMRYYDLLHDGNIGKDDGIGKPRMGNQSDYHKSTDPIPMQFKTGSNCVIQLDKSLDFNNLGYVKEKKNDKEEEDKNQPQGYWLPLVEIYRETENKFGGDSEDALKQNAWLVAGDPVDLSDTVDLFWDYGDTYYQRYDCLKTMPYSDSSVNNIIEILSFFCETRINIDGRYDTNRGLQDNTDIRDTNFNQLNKVYSQQNNYFQYYISDEDLAKIDTYQNQIVWSLTKGSGDITDPWTNITLLNSLDLDGSKGPVRAIKNFNGQLYTFQDSGIAGIRYNQNVMLNSKDGVPIEIGNSGKVTGVTYISTSQGCLNKWAIADVGQGIIFLDSLNRELSLFNGQQIINLGEKAKFQSWIRKNCYSTDQWNPLWENIDSKTITFMYDNSADEVLLTSKDFSIAYNLGLLRFTSFYSYEATPWLINHKSNQYLISKRQDIVDNSWNFWEIRQGDYNRFFNVFKPYYIEFAVTDNQYFDYMKLFYLLEIRDTIVASLDDTYDGSIAQDSLQNSFSFDHILVYNSYQNSGTKELEFKSGWPSNLKAKLRTWRINVPRNSNRGHGRVKDRIKDHYMITRLSHDNESYNQTKIHDIIASYMI